MTSKDLPLPANVPSPVDVSSSKDLPSPANVPSPIDVSSSTDIHSLTYSTLEFNQNTIKTYLPTQGLIPVTSEDDPLPQAVQSNPLDNPNSENDTTFIHGGEAPRKFGGISIKKWGIMIVGVVLVVLGAVLGGIFGTHNNRHHDTEMTHGTETTSVEISTTTITTISPSSTLDLNILPNSNITATSLFDREKPGDTAYRFVVFQDVTSALIFRAWNSTAKVWVTKNLTQITQNSAPINVMTGTPLTSVALLGSHSWWVKVWCLHPDGGILAITLNMFSVFENSNEHLLYDIKLNTVPMDDSDRDSRTSLAASVHSIIDVPGEESDFAYLVYQYKSGIVCVSQWNSEGKLPDIATFILEGASVSHQSHLYLASLSQRLKSENSSTLSLSYESNGSWFEVYVNFTSYPGESSMRPANQPLMPTSPS